MFPYVHMKTGFSIHPTGRVFSMAYNPTLMQIQQQSLTKKHLCSLKITCELTIRTNNATRMRLYFEAKTASLPIRLMMITAKTLAMNTKLHTQAILLLMLLYFRRCTAIFVLSRAFSEDTFEILYSTFFHSCFATQYIFIYLFHTLLL